MMGQEPSVLLVYELILRFWVTGVHVLAIAPSLLIALYQLP